MKAIFFKAAPELQEQLILIDLVLRSIVWYLTGWGGGVTRSLYIQFSQFHWNFPYLLVEWRHKNVLGGLKRCKLEFLKHPVLCVGISYCLNEYKNETSLSDIFSAFAVSGPASLEN